MALELTDKQLDLLQYANDSRDFSMYIYNVEKYTPPSGWTSKLVVNNNDISGLYFEIDRKSVV